MTTEYVQPTTVTEPIVTEEVPVYEPTAAEKFASLFEKNFEDQWQLALPDLPQVSWTDVDDQEVTDWFQGKMDESTAQGQKWADAWMTYEDAIAQPWNDFVTRAEQLSVEDAELDMQTDEEIIRFISDNTYVDGTSLTDTYPQINEWIADMKNSTDWEAVFNYDAIRAPMDSDPQPVMLQSYYDQYPSDVWGDEPPCRYTCQAEGYNRLDRKECNRTRGCLWDPNQYVCMTNVGWDEPCSAAPPSKFESAMDEAMTVVQDKAVEYGFDPAVVKQWLMDQGESWHELSREQDKQNHDMAMAQIKEAADYVKNILDNMTADLRNRQVEEQANFEQEVDAYTTELKNQVDTQAKDEIAKLDQWFADTYGQVTEFSEISYEEVEDMIMGADEATPVMMQSYYEDPYYYEDEYVEEPTPFEKAMEEAKTVIGDKAVEYGFDAEVVHQWLMDEGASWQELSREQDKQNHDLAMGQIKEAADYFKGIFDNMTADLRNIQAEEQANFEQEVDAFSTELKSQVDAQAKDDIAKLDQWFSDMYGQISDITEISYEEVEDMIMGEDEVAEAPISLAKKAPKKARAAKQQDSSFVGYAAITMAAAVVAGAYFYKKRQQTKESTVDQNTVDEDFVLV